MVFYDSNNNGPNPYVPGPVPTGHICMEKELIELAMAKQLHEKWASKKLVKDGHMENNEIMNSKPIHA